MEDVVDIKDDNSKKTFSHSNQLFYRFYWKQRQRSKRRLAEIKEKGASICSSLKEIINLA